MPKPIGGSVPAMNLNERVLGANGEKRRMLMNGTVAAITGLGACILAAATISCLKAGIFACATGAGAPLGVALIALSVGLGVGTFVVGGTSLYFGKRFFERL
jgi:hypothetical protein